MLVSIIKAPTQELGVNAENSSRARQIYRLKCRAVERCLSAGPKMRRLPREQKGRALLVQRIKEKTGRDVNGFKDVAPGRQVVTHLDFPARGIIVQEDIGGVLGDNGLERSGPTVYHVFLPDDNARLLMGHSPGHVARLRPEVPD